MRNRWFGPLLLLATIAVSVILWPRLPDQVATHWNVRGEPDGWSSRLWAAILGPVAVALVLGVFRFGRLVDPRRANYVRFEDTYWIVSHGVAVILAVIHAGVLADAAGLDVDVFRMTAFGIAGVLMLLGNVFGRLQSNWFLGIRTPWTLDNPEVWRKTHRAAGWLFVGAGVAAAIGALLRSGTDSLVVAAVATGIASVASVILSFVYWKKEARS